jgi:hypothetical protein
MGDSSIYSYMGVSRHCRHSRFADGGAPVVPRTSWTGWNPCFATLLAVAHRWRTTPLCTPCASLVHPLYIWGINVNVGALIAGGKAPAPVMAGAVRRER